VRCKVGDLASIYSFNATGSLIWQSLESPKSLAELIAIVERDSPFITSRRNRM